MKPYYLLTLLLLIPVTTFSQKQESAAVASAPTVSSKEIQGKFVHMVFFWLKPETDQKEFVAGTKAFLEKIDVVRQYHLGTPALTPRDVVDNSYTICLVVTFDTKEDHDRYQQHEAHLRYVEQMKSSWTRVQIYDSFDTF